MKRRVFFTTLVAATCLSALPVLASVSDSIVAQLKAQGFGNIHISRTFLGRTRITAESQKLRREIIVNPRTGEILRDYWENLLTGEETTGQILTTNGSGGNSGSGSGSGNGGEGGDDGHDDGSGGDGGGGDSGGGSGDGGGDSGDSGGDGSGDGGGDGGGDSGDSGGDSGGDGDGGDGDSGGDGGGGDDGDGGDDH